METPETSRYAGLLPTPDRLVDLPRLLDAFESLRPDPEVAAQRVSFGTSGHRGSSLESTFNRNHILAITQAICAYRRVRGITGPVFMGFDSHALSVPAFHAALEVLAANGETVLIADRHELTPTPVVSYAILEHNRGRSSGLADGIVITPSHNPPGDGGFKYNPPHGGPADKGVTDWIQEQANAHLASALRGVKRVELARALSAETTRFHDFRTPYIQQLGQIIDLRVIRDSRIRVGVNPLGGAGLHYWPLIADHYGLDLRVLEPRLDPQFAFVNQDWDGQIRMDPSSPYAMGSVVEQARSCDIAFACDTDHDRHGVVTRHGGLMPANDYLSAAVFYLFGQRPQWASTLRIGKTCVSSRMIDRVAEHLDRPLLEVPVGFKWFVDGLLDANLAFAGEESAGATFLRLDGRTWTTDKDGMVAGLLAAEMTARQGKDPATQYRELVALLGEPHYRRIERPASRECRERLGRVAAGEVSAKQLGGEPVRCVLDRAPGNGAAIGGLKIETEHAWFAARPSGTEDIYKIYAESWSGSAHLARVIEEGAALVEGLINS